MILSPPHPKLPTPSTLGFLFKGDQFDFADHVVEMERIFLKLFHGKLHGKSRLICSYPKRHTKSFYSNLFISWCLLNWPELRILRVMDSAKTAQMEAQEVIKIVDEWGKHTTGNTWNPRRKAKECPYMEAGGYLDSRGMESNPDSWTYDILIADDILSAPEDIRNPRIRDQMFRDLVQKFFSRVDPTGHPLYICIQSRMHPQDVPGRLLEMNATAQEENRWEYFVKQALIDEGLPTERALWPNSTEMNLEKLKEKKRSFIEKGDQWQWYCQYQNDPRQAPDFTSWPIQYFPDSCWYDDADSIPRFKYLVISVDPNWGKPGDKLCFYSCVVFGIGENNHLYIHDSYIKQSGLESNYEGTLQLLSKYQDHTLFAFEDNAAQLAMADSIWKMAKQQGIPCRLEAYNWFGNNEKEFRIQGALNQYIPSQKLHIRRAGDNRVLWQQLKNFPQDYLDGPDSLATGLYALDRRIGENKKR